MRHHDPTPSSAAALLFAAVALTTACGGSGAEPTGTTPAEQVTIAPTHLEPEDDLARMRYEHVLGQLYANSSPPIDDVLGLVVELGRSASIVDGSLGFDGRQTTGQVLLREVGLQASLTADPRGLQIFLAQLADQQSYSSRSLRIGITIDGRGALVTGHITVVHHFDVSQPDVLREIGDSTIAVGWAISGSTVDGLRADPTLAQHIAPPGGGDANLVVGTEATRQFDDPGRPTAIVRPYDKDLRAWEPWRELHAELAGRD